MSILKKGLKGAPVQRLQEKLGIAADGVFGPGTEKAVKAFQSSKGLAADGIVGPDTFTALGMPELVLLRKGLKGETVKKLQSALGLKADGAFGPATEAAVKEFQSKNGLLAVGMADPMTLAKLNAIEGLNAVVAAAAKLKPEEEHFEEEPLPELQDNQVVAGKANDAIAEVLAKAQAAAAEAEKPAERSVWSKITGWGK